MNEARRSTRGVVALACLGAAAVASGWFPARAHACGVSADGVWSCSLEEHDEEVRPKFRIGAGYVYTSTALRFTSKLRGDETRNAAIMSAAYAPTRRFSLQLSAGGSFGGELRMPDARYEFADGPIAAFGAAYRLVEGRPFVLLTSTLSASTSRTRARGSSGGSVAYTAADLRIGAIAGTTLFNALSPYVLARAFGGPVFWRYLGRAETGTDTHHYQFGAGVALALAERLDFFFEGVPLGERGVSSGLSAAF